MDAAALEGDPPRSADPAASKRPGMVALLYAYRAVAALLIATPTALVAGDIVSGYPRGDAELFDPGGVMLVEAARLARRALTPLLLQGGLGALVAALVGLIPFAALIAALGHEGKLSARFLASRAVAPLGPLALLWGSALLGQVVVVALVVLVGEKLLESAGLGMPREDIARLAIAGVGLVLALAIGVVHDLARVVAVLEGRGFYTSAARALHVMEEAYPRALWAYAWRGAIALAGLSAAGWVAAGFSRWFGAVSGQAAVLLAVFLRASWLAAAIRITASVAAPDPRSLTAELDDLPPPAPDPGEDIAPAHPTLPVEETEPRLEEAPIPAAEEPSPKAPDGAQQNTSSE